MDINETSRRLLQLERKAGAIVEASTHFPTLENAHVRFNSSICQLEQSRDQLKGLVNQLQGRIGALEGRLNEEQEEESHSRWSALVARLNQIHQQQLQESDTRWSTIVERLTRQQTRDSESRWSALVAVIREIGSTPPSYDHAMVVDLQAKVRSWERDLRSLRDSLNRNPYRLREALEEDVQHPTEELSESLI